MMTNKLFIIFYSPSATFKPFIANTVIKKSSPPLPTYNSDLINGRPLK